jgi:alkylmercury lyase
MKTGEVANEAGVNLQTLRYYERRGLLPEPPRRESGYRIYGPDAVRIVRFIKRAQELGFSLNEVESLLELADGGPDRCDDAQLLARQRVAELDRRISDLRAMRDSLQQLLATCSMPRAERECPLLQSIEEAAGALGDGRMSADDVSRNVATVEQIEGFQLLPHLVRLLAEGQPVALEELAAASSWPLPDIEAALRRQPAVDWDEHGRLVGFGLTLRPTPHRFTFDGRTVFGFCASDALFFPVILGRAGVVESACPVTGRPIRVELSPERVERVEPSGAVVSLVRPTDGVEDIRAEICALGHFFASREAAAEWLAAHPEGMVHSVEEDFQLHRDVVEKLGWADVARPVR